MVVEKLNEDSIVVNERACAERISEALNWHGVVVDTDGLVDVKLFPLDSLYISSLFAKDSEAELAVVDVHQGILLTSGVLLHFFASNVTVFVSSNHLGEGVLVSLKTVHHDPEFPIVFLDHSDRSCGVITDDTGNNWELGLNILGLCQVLEQLSIVVELKIWLQLLITLSILSLVLLLGPLRFIIIVGNILTTCVSSLAGVTTLVDLEGSITVAVACFSAILLG